MEKRRALDCIIRRILSMINVMYGRRHYRVSSNVQIGSSVLAGTRCIDARGYVCCLTLTSRDRSSPADDLGALRVGADGGAIQIPGRRYGTGRSGPSRRLRRALLLRVSL